MTIASHTFDEKDGTKKDDYSHGMCIRERITYSKIA